MAHPIPPAVVPAGVPPPLLQEAAMVAPRTYRELYADAANNPTFDRTAAYLAGYRFAGEGVIPTPIQLRDQTVSMSDRQPMAFLCMIAGPPEGPPEVSVVHRLLRFMDLPGDEPSGFHDKVLGLLGDIMPHQYPVVETPGSLFHLVGTPVRVPTVAAMEALLPTWVDPRAPLGPFTEQDPETEVVRPRNTQLIPGRYASLIIHRRRITAKQAYQEIVGAIRADEALESCNDVVVWLRAACTARGGGGAQNALPSVHHPLVPLHMPPEVYQYVTQKVQTDLPALKVTGDVGNPGTTATLIGALRALTQREPGNEDQERERPAREARSIVEAYKETHRVLLRYCNVANPDDVAPVWKRLSNCHKSEQHTLLTQEMQKVCMARGLSTELYVPVVTTTLKQMIVGFQFAGHNADDLATGCQPFMVAYAGKAHHLQVTAASSVANQLSQGEQNASLADIRSIRDGEKIKFPNDITEVCITLFRYAVLCQSLFQGVGPPHPFVEALWSTAVGLQNIAPFVTDRYQELARLQNVTRTYHARIVRAVQVNAHEYLQQVATNVVDSVAGVEVPNFASMLQELRRGTFHHSTNWMDIPSEYLDHTSTQHTPSVAAPAPAGGSGGGTVPAGSVNVHSARTSVSTLSGEATRAPVTRITNPVTDSDFTAITLRAGGTRTILREHRPPANDAGQEFCVAWWTKGGCFPNCGRRATHQPFASPGERSRLLAFVRERLAAHATTAGASS